MKKTNGFNRAGQGTTEIALLLPLFVLLGAGVLSVAYICLQGIKVQQAANLAARIQGQERVGGGASSDSIAADNGTDGSGDKVPGMGANMDNLSSFQSEPTGGVYLKYYKAVQDMFGAGERKKLFIPPPTQGINSDRVDVIRILKPPKIFGMEIAPIKLEARAYGGEDSHMYSLPRWGRAGNNNGQFYKGAIKNPDNN